LRLLLNAVLTIRTYGDTGHPTGPDYITIERVDRVAAD